MTEKLHQVRRFPEQEQRVESGPIMFGDDWPGLFLRGDDCFRYTLALRELVLDNAQIGFITKQVVLGLLEALESSDARNNVAQGDDMTPERMTVILRI